jgi:hypothetical protein
VDRNAIKLALLIVVGLCLGGAASEPVEIDVTMIDYRFVPNHLSLKAWRPLSFASCK